MSVSTYIKSAAIGLIAVALVSLGFWLHYEFQKPAVLKCPDCPTCPNCPSIEVQSIDVSQLKKIKGGFTFAPVYNGDVTQITKCDTAKKLR